MDMGRHGRKGNWFAPVLLATIFFAVACSDGRDGDAAGPDSSARSSGAADGPDSSGEETDIAESGDPDGDVDSDGSGDPGASEDPDGSGDLDRDGAEADPDGDPEQGPVSDGAGSDDPGSEGPDGSVPEPELRPDGLELAFADGSLGSARLGATIEEITEALGPAYTITREESIRVDFPGGYSVARDGEVLFFAIEEGGVITVFMTQHSRVGLDNGLRPKKDLTQAVALHGPPTFTIGPEGREFVSFEDGTGGGGDVSILVAIGQFGGPVGVYQSFELGQETSEFIAEEANIKELWFWAR